MKKILFIVFLCISSITANAQLLWKISGNGLDSPSYIFGTHHVAPLSICDSIKGFGKAFKETKQLYGELDMSFVNDLSIMQKMQSAMMMPKDKDYNDLFTEEEYKQIDDACKKYMNIGLDMLKMMKPMAIASQIAVIMSSRHFPDLAKGEQLDIEMQNRARKAGMPVKGLETVEYQTNLMFNMPLETQARYLLDTVKSEKDAEITTKNLADAYMKQDLEKLEDIFRKEEMKDDVEFTKLLVNDRNHNWVEQMKKIMPELPAFFVVGAGHLPGEEGVIELLKKEGFKLEPVW